MNKQLIIAILALITAICIIVPRMCPNTMNNLFPKIEEIPKVEISRFQQVETFPFGVRVAEQVDKLDRA